MSEGQAQNLQPVSAGSVGWKARWVGWRNRVLGSPRFQKHAARNPLLRPVARARAAAVFDLVAGFVYSQTLLAAVESGFMARLAQGPASTEELAKLAGLSHQAAERLARAGVAIELFEIVGEGWWMLGRHGAALHGNAGALAMIRHHHLLYQDLADPMALLRADRAESTALSRFWTYADGGGSDPQAAAAYSQLMADSQAAVAAEVLAAVDFRRFESLLDVGGGHGAFVSAVAKQHPALRLALFDLPDVASQAQTKMPSITAHGGDFFEGPIPAGFDCISLVRILHDHDDAPVMQLLSNIRAALKPGTTLLIAEPMAGVSGAEAMGDAYFGLYLWAMRSGRPRSEREIAQMLGKAGFQRVRSIPTTQPIVTSIVVAFA